MISNTADYALRAIVFLADNAGEAHTTEEIARATKVPVGYLAKIMQNLARHRLVASQRGLHGGFTLVRDPKELTIYDVVQAVDPIARIDRCPLQLEGHGTDLCPLHRTVDEALARVEEIFRRTTIHEMIHQPGAKRPLCSYPSEEAGPVASA
ncbi:MAG: Rrf2 family transcriptional regulator [Planctomycetota bacterium]|nr:Rrf2 family transcriptional regulator [Planctomycetota bacterium]MDW8373191.1 Rrf2 family transcriptional regulator [Planctomycetota bacterium]